MFGAALTHIFPPSLLKLFSSRVTSSAACPVTSSEAPLTAGVVQHQDVVHGDVAPPLPGDGRLDQDLQRGRARKGSVTKKSPNILGEKRRGGTETGVGGGAPYGLVEQ